MENKKTETAKVAKVKCVVGLTQSRDRFNVIDENGNVIGSGFKTIKAAVAHAKSIGYEVR